MRKLIGVKRYMSLCVLATVVVLLNAGCGKDENHLEVAKAYLNDSKVDEALFELKKAVEKDPESAEAYYVMGNIYFDKNMYDDALVNYNQAITIKPYFADAHVRIMDTFNRMPAPVDEFTRNKNGVINNPDDPMAHLRMGYYFHKVGKTVDAVEQYEIAAQLAGGKQNPFILYNLAVAYHDMDLYERAVPFYKESIALNPDYDKVHYNLGVAYQENDDIEEAVKEYKKTLEINPNYGAVYVNIGQINLKADKFDDAIDLYKKAIGVQPDLARAHYELGIVHILQERFDEAKKENKIALDLDPEYANAQFNIAVIHHKKGELERALEEYNKTIDIDKMYENAFYQRGLVFQQLGDYGQSYNDYLTYNKILKLKTGSESPLVMKVQDTDNEIKIRPFLRDENIELE